MKEELLKIEGAYLIGKHFIRIDLECGIEVTIDATDGYVSFSRKGDRVMVFSTATKEEVLNLVKALMK